MEPETQAKVKEWDSKVEERKAKLLLIRKNAEEAYKTNKIGECVSAVTKEVMEIMSTCDVMSKEQVGTLIGQLETARSIFSALTQGLQIAYANEKEPEFAKKHEAREREARKSKPKTLEGILAAQGISLEQVMAALDKTGGNKAEVKPANNKIKCENCSAEFFPAMKGMHKCP